MKKQTFYKGDLEIFSSNADQFQHITHITGSLKIRNASVSMPKLKQIGLNLLIGENCTVSFPQLSGIGSLCCVEPGNDICLDRCSGVGSVNVRSGSTLSLPLCNTISNGPVQAGSDATIHLEMCRTIYGFVLARSQANIYLSDLCQVGGEIDIADGANLHRIKTPIVIDKALRNVYKKLCAQSRGSSAVY